MRRLPPGIAALIAPLLVAPALVSTPAQAATPAPAFMRWNSTAELAQGERSSTVAVSNGTVVLKSGTQGAWRSPWRSTGYAAKTLIPSWTGSTPSGTKLKIQVRVKSGSTVGSWDDVAHWGTRMKRLSGSAQSDDLARVAVDTIKTNAGKSFTAYQVRVTLWRSSTATTSPRLGSVNAVASPWDTRSRATSKTTMTRTVDLAVPVASQMIHRNHYPEFNGGGDAWCSPTSASMLMGYAGLLPKPSYYAYTREKQGYVDHAARYAYDYAYQGTGNWAFTTAYAAQYGADAFVTRLASFAEAEQLIKAGIPMAISIAFPRGGLSGAPLSSTPGHLLVVRGFTADGSPIVNDPAAPANSSVRRVYSRAQLEKAWQEGSGGVTYVVRKPTTKLPAGSARWRP